MEEGGSYIVNPETGKRERVEHTQDHPEGNCARDAEGKPLGQPTQPVQAQNVSLEAAPAPAPKKSGGK